MNKTKYIIIPAVEHRLEWRTPYYVGEQGLIPASLLIRLITYHLAKSCELKAKHWHHNALLGMCLWSDVDKTEHDKWKHDLITAAL